MKFILVASLSVVAAEYMKGYVRMPRNGVVKVANITDEMRASLPVSLDWSTSGATTPVKDQGQCGSCWAYSATEGIESGLFMATGTLTKLSEQQIISCDTTDLGCNGGDLPTAFQYIETSGGIEAQSLYPDTSSTSSATGTCKNVKKYTAKVTDWAYAITPCPSGGSCKTQAESDLVAALNTFGPLSVCLNAGSWNSYNGGIFNPLLGCSGAESKMDHCVQLVGYDTAQQYWKVRNSWGTSWGEAGFIRLKMGINQCGIANEATYVSAALEASEVNV